MAGSLHQAAFAGGSGTSRPSGDSITVGQPTIVSPHHWTVPSYLRHSTFHSHFTVGASASVSADSGSSKAIPRADTRSLKDLTIPLPSKLDSKHCCKRLLLSGDAGVQFMPERDELGREKSNRSDPDKDAAAVRADHPIPPQCGIYYFEMTVVSKGLKGYIGIGFSTRNVNLERLPGWDSESYGYHGDDGKAFSCSGTGSTYGPKFGKDDVVGCGIDFAQRQAFFTKNGTWLGYTFDLNHAQAKSKDGEMLKFYPSVGLQTAGEQVKINFGQEPFKWDIGGFAKRRKQETMSAALSASIPRSLVSALSHASTSSHTKSLQEASLDDPTLLSTSLQNIVAAYLSHRGYTDTARSFRRQRQETQSYWNDLFQHNAEASTSGSATADGGRGSAETSVPGTPASGKKGKKQGVSTKKVLKSALRSTLAKEASSGSLGDSAGAGGDESMGDASLIVDGDDAGDESMDVEVDTTTPAASQGKKDRSTTTLRDDFLVLDAPSSRTSAPIFKLEDDPLLETSHIRQSICLNIRNGRVDKALEEMEAHYPTLLDASVEQGQGGEHDLLFRLRARNFVEMVLQSESSVERGESETGMDAEESADVDELEDEEVASELLPSSTRSSKGKGKRVEIPSSSAPSLDNIIAYGTYLNSTYLPSKTSSTSPSFSSTYYSSHLSLIFSLLAYSSLSTPAHSNPQLIALTSQEARASLAEEVNASILRHLGGRDRPILEDVWRQAQGVLSELGVRGEGKVGLVELDGIY